MGLIPLAPLTKTRAVAFVTLGFGALAQLGERLHGMQEVSGSIPLGSTIFLKLHYNNEKVLNIMKV